MKQKETIINKNLTIITTDEGQMNYSAEAIVKTTGEIFKTSYRAKAPLTAPRALQQKCIWEDASKALISFTDIVRKSYRHEEEYIIDKINSLIEMNDLTYYKMRDMTGLTQTSFIPFAKTRENASPALSTLIIVADCLGYKVKLVKNEE